MTLEKRISCMSFH